MEIIQWLFYRMEPPVISKLSGFKIDSLIAWAEGRALAGPRTITRLTNLYNTISFTQAFTAGFSESRATELSRQAPWIVDLNIQRMDTYISVMAQSKGVEESIIRDSMNRSDKPLDEIERSTIKAYDEAEELE